MQDQTVPVPGGMPQGDGIEGSLPPLRDLFAETGPGELFHLILEGGGGLRGGEAADPELSEKWAKTAHLLWQWTAPRMTLYPASVQYHHRWPGGLGDHCAQVAYLMGIQAHLYGMEIPRGKIVAMALLHDWNKLTRYCVSGGKFTPFGYRPPQQHSTDISVGRVVGRFQMPVDRDFLNALCLSEGGWSTLARTSRVEVSPLACLLHCADLTSAKVFGQDKNWKIEKVTAEMMYELQAEERLVLTQNPDEEYL